MDTDIPSSPPFHLIKIKNLMDIFFLLFYQPAYNLLLVAYSYIPNGLGLLLGIILIGLIVRLIMFPLVKKQVLMSTKNIELQEKMKKIKDKYADHKEKYTEEVMKLNSEYMPAMISGCLPMIFQIILFINIDHVIRDLFNPSKGVTEFTNFLYNPNILNGNFSIDSKISFFDIAAIPNQILSDQGFLNFLPYLIIILLTAIIQFFSLKMTFYYSKKRKSQKQKEAKKNKADDEDMAESVARTTQQMMFLFPALLFFGALTFPVGLTIYWLVQSLFGILQQYYFIKLLDRQANQQ
jgi:YidC/Oxa1 family membrane protein insertase